MDQQFIQSLEQTLSLVLSPENSAIKQATQQLKNEFYPNPMALPSLIQILQSSSNEGIKKLAAVEAKKLVSKQWATLDPSIQQSIRDSILQFAFTYPNQSIRHSTARLISEIAEIDIPDKKWTNLLQSLVDASTDSNKQTREMATFTLYCILETFPMDWLNHTQSFLDLFATTLQDNESPEVQVTSILALEVLSSFIEEEETLVDALAPAFSSLFPAMLQVLKNSLAFDDTDKTRDLFTAFNSFILLDMKFLNNHFITIINFMVEVSLNADIDAEIRGFALKTLTQCISYRKSKISQAQLGSSLAQAALRIAAEEDDEAEEKLSKEDEENENEEDEPNTLALRLLNTLSIDLPPNQVIQPVLELAPQLLSSTNPFERRAALLSIGVTVEGAPDYINTQLPKIIQLIQAGLQDPSIIVKAAALRTLSQLGEELKDAVAEYHTALLEPIIAIIDSTEKIMVYKYATYALDTLIEYMASESIKAYVEPLMNKLFHMLDTAQSSSLKSAIVSAIGSVAYASGKSFTPYFEHSIKFLEKFIENMETTEGMTEDDIELRAQTFENISSMARAVGSEAFGPYAEPLMNASYSAIHSDNGRLREAGFAFISNMAKVYGEQFTSFLDRIIPEIYKCLEQDEINFNFEDDELEDVNEAELAEKMNIHTGITVEKEVALVALSELALGTKAGFAPYVEKTMTILAQQIDESYAVREAALSTMWKIALSMFKAFGAENTTVLALIQTVRKTTVELLPEEFDTNMVLTCLDSFFEYVKQMGKIAIIDSNDSSSLQTLLEQISLIMNNEHICQAQEDEDIPSDEDSSEMEAVVYDSALEVLVSLSTAFGAAFAEIFIPFKESILSQVNSKSKNKRVSALGCLAEICNGMKTNNPYAQELLEMFVNKLTTDKSSEVRGNAAYGVGIVIEHAQFDTASAYPTILQALSKLLNKADKEALKTEDGDDETKEVINRTFANACGCVSRMTLKNTAAVPLDVILPVLFEHLPLETGFEENTPIFELIIKLFTEGNDWLKANTSRVVDIFEGVFEKEAEKEKLIAESTLGREENVERLNQFENDEIKSKVIVFLKWLNNEAGGAVSSKAILKTVIA